MTVIKGITYIELPCQSVIAVKLHLAVMKRFMKCKNYHLYFIQLAQYHHPIIIIIIYATFDFLIKSL